MSYQTTLQDARLLVSLQGWRREGCEGLDMGITIWHWSYVWFYSACFWCSKPPWTSSQMGSVRVLSVSDSRATVTGSTNSTTSPSHLCSPGEIMCLVIASWSIGRYSSNFDPFALEKPAWNWSHFYQTLQGLQKFKIESNYAEVVDKLFSLFPDKEHYYDAGPERCRICAVVGNSGNLKGSHYGRLIDLHDFVIRYEYVAI